MKTFRTGTVLAATLIASNNAVKIEDKLLEQTSASEHDLKLSQLLTESSRRERPTCKIREAEKKLRKEEIKNRKPNCQHEGCDPHQLKLVVEMTRHG